MTQFEQTRIKNYHRFHRNMIHIVRIISSNYSLLIHSIPYCCRDPSTSTLYDKKNHRNSTDRSELVLDLPDDIYLSARSATDRTDRENEAPLTNHHRKDSDNGKSRVVNTTEWLFLGYDGFFTEPSIEPRRKSEVRRNAFRKVAIGILFLTTLKHRSIHNRAVSFSKKTKIAIRTKLFPRNEQGNLQVP